MVLARTLARIIWRYSKCTIYAETRCCGL